MQFHTNNITEFMTDVLSTRFFQLNHEYDNTPAIEAVLDPGESRLVLITGDNATGKSFLRRLITSALRQENIECMHLSQQGRSESGIQRAFLYGDEECQSTGYISSYGIRKGIQTCQGRTNKHVLWLDEPDLGLSDEYAAGAGIEIKDFILKIPELTFCVFLVTHSKAMVKELLPCKPWHLRLGGCLELTSWLNREIKPKSLADLKEYQHKKSQRISEIMNRKKS